MFILNFQGRVKKTGVYSACKAAITALSKTAAKEWATVPIRCNVVEPGLIKTPMTAATNPTDRDKVGTECFMGRMGTAEGLCAGFRRFPANTKAFRECWVGMFWESFMESFPKIL